MTAKRALFLFIVTLCALAQNPTHAQKKKRTATLPDISFPVDCTLGTDCFIAYHPDTNPMSDDTEDFACGKKTFDGHTGLSIALADMEIMRSGINVKPILAGTITRARDGQTDTIKSTEDLDALEKNNKACGNGILIDHTIAGYAGLRSVYCHLKQDSITVKDGDTVSPEDTIAQIGHSGNTTFPHLHFSLVWEGATLDTFAGRTIRTDENICAAKYSEDDSALWKDKIPYEPITLFASGFQNTKPNFTDIIQNTHPTNQPTSNDKTLVFWAGFFGLQKHDVLAVTITNPANKVFATRKITHDKFHKRQYYFAGRQSTRPLIPGTYTAHIKITRGSLLLMDQKETITVN